MPKDEVHLHVTLHTNRIVLDVQALAWATALIAAASGTAACGSDTSHEPPAASTGGVPGIGPGVCAVFVNGGATSAGTSSPNGGDSGDADASGYSSGGSNYGGGVCALI